MRKLIFSSICVFVFGALSVSAQPTENTNSSSTKTPVVGERVFKIYNAPTKDVTEQFEISGIGTTTFQASNIADGTINSYKHNMQIKMTLIPVKTGNNNFQLIFYQEYEHIQQAATYADGVLNIYYPIAMYEGIKQKLDQYLAAKKKVFVKVVQLTNGYREGTLIF